MNVRMDFTLSDESAESLVDLAMRRGFLREDPRKRMSEKDRREAIRYAVWKLIQEHAAKNP